MATDKLELRWPAWIGLIVEVLQGQRAFYRDVLGLQERGSGNDWVWFDMGEGRLFELLAPQQAAIYKPGFTISFQVDDIQAAVEELESRGVQRITDVEGGPSQRSTGATSWMPRAIDSTSSRSSSF
ncbi:MAG: VOC family protein [Actinomycetota bacterium]